MRNLGVAIASYVTPEQAEKIRIIKEHMMLFPSVKKIWKLSQEYQEQVKMIQIVPRFSVL